MPSDVQIPNNKVIESNRHLATTRRKKVKTVTNVRPGRLAVRDTDDDHFKVASAGATHGIHGWVNRNYSDLDWDETSDPTAEDEFDIKAGVGVGFKAALAAGENVQDGDLLVAGANGTLKKATVQSVTVPSGTTTVTSTAAQPDLTEAGSIPPDGVVVAKAKMDKDNSAGADPVDIVVTSLIA